MMDDLTGLTEFDRTLSDASELLAAFIGCGRGNATPTANLLIEAQKTLDELVKWRDGLKGAAPAVGCQR